MIMKKQAALIGFGICILMIVTVLTESSILGDAESTESHENQKPKTFNILLQRGQYVFIGYDTGKKGKQEIEQGTRPLKKVQIDPNSTSQWDMCLKYEPRTNDDGNKVWNWSCTWKRHVKTTHRVTSLICDMPLPIPENGKIESVEMPTIELLADVEINGIMVLKIPYAKVDGETNYLVVCIGDNKESFKEKISIAKSFLLFEWDKRWQNLK